MTLEVNKISKWLGANKVLDEVSFDLPSGRILALFGQNGAGKSTLLRILAGVMDADAGQAKLDGQRLLENRASGKTILGYVPEAADAPPHLTPRELVALVASLKQTPIPKAELFVRVGIEAYLDQFIGSLSLGQRRRTCLAAALCGDVKLLLLDEPTNGLDSSGVIMLVDILLAHARAGGIAVVATHDEMFANQLEAQRLRLLAGRLAPFDEKR